MRFSKIPARLSRLLAGLGQSANQILGFGKLLLRSEQRAAIMGCGIIGYGQH
ncbi:MAG: hypothetical protein J2P13_06520 [Acidobacteria bacterium]|nr:hypothetical protein [Acidobacteriota bacterium]